MSTELGYVNGKQEIPDASTKTSEYIPAKLHITRFWGGPRGMCVQLSVNSSPEGHIQLDMDSVRKLHDVLHELV